MTIALAPVSGSAVEPMCPVISIPRPIITEARTEEEPDADWRNEDRRARGRWRCVIVIRSGSLVRLNHICAGVRA